MRRVEATPPDRFTTGAALAIVAIGFFDHFTGPIVSLLVLYLVPVTATAWIAGTRRAHALALLAAITWAVADRIGPLAEPKAPIAYLNDISMLAVFLFLNVVVSTLRKQTERERDLIQEVQRHLLPSVPSLPNVDIASRWIPAWTVAGDYYDVIEAGPHRIAICLADVSGKGMAAALTMSNVQATIHALTADRLAPEHVLGTLNRVECHRLRRGSFVTIFYALLDTENGELLYASGGHNPPLLRRADGTLVRLEPTGPVTGILPGAEYHSVRIQLTPGDRLVIYSDGVTEYENREGDEFGEGRLRELLSRSEVGSAEQICSSIVETLARFGRNRPYDDDVTMLVIACAPPV